MTSTDQLLNLGPKSKRSQPTASLNLLWALAAGLRNKHWQELSAGEKLRLKQQLEELS